ncbi:recombinase family protein [Runella aurantiaca]|uniref:Recombinase family protein n=1 Tax=Runella aurantiaca TaxID=2282308 RepID=A0A369IE71_9BACT|nr:recombinase family protein [Runella aurantiaca]RDB08081.1 recombinase family protein [Runella aurantiaca]
MRIVGFTREISEPFEKSAIQAITDEIVIGGSGDLEKTVESLQAGDSLVIYKLFRLGNHLSIINRNVRLVIDKGIILKSLTEGIDSSTPDGKRQIELITHLALQTTEESVRSLTQGRKAAVEKGVKLGPQKGTLYKFQDIAEQVYQMYLTKQHTMEEIRTHFGIGSRGTVYKIIKLFENPPGDGG